MTSKEVLKREKENRNGNYFSKCIPEECIYNILSHDDILIINGEIDLAQIISNLSYLFPNNH
jgi:hypothetical protein